MTTLAPSPLCGLPRSPTARPRGRSLPMRTLNARMWGHSSSDEGTGSRPVKLGGCGRPHGEAGRVAVVALGGRWLPVGLATCDNTLLCDFCGPRRLAESAEKFGWLFEDHLAGGGELLHLRLGVPHQLSDDPAWLLAQLKACERALRKDCRLKAVGVTSFVRSLDVTWSPVHGWNLHYHVVAFIRAGRPVDIDQVQRTLTAAWGDKVWEQMFRRTSAKGGVFARVFGDSVQALYSWRHRHDQAEETSDVYHPQGDLERPDYHPGFDDDHRTNSWGLADIAVAALEEDQRAWRLWESLSLALYNNGRGERVIGCSKDLDELWNAYQATQPEPVDEESVVDAPEVLMVCSRVWEAARRAGLTQLGLALAETSGPVALAGWWGDQLGRPLTVVDWGVGPPTLEYAR